MTIKNLLTILFGLSFSHSFGQFALVDDKDFSVNVRSDRNNKVIDQLPNGHLIYCFGNIDNWTTISYAKNGKNYSGCVVYKDRYQLVSNFRAFSVSANSKNSVTLKKDSLEVFLSQSNFDQKRHTFKYYKDNNTQLEFIDGKQYWGKDGGMPETQYGKISIKIGAKTIDLPSEALEGLYQPSFHKVTVNYDTANEIIYVQSVNSDGAGGYDVIWKVEKGIYKERLIAYGF